MTKTKAFRTFIGMYSVLKSERLNTNLKLILHKPLIRSIMTYDRSVWELATEIYFSRLQPLL
jgi:hypothetical protein